MTDRGLTAGAVTETEAAEYRAVVFCELMFATPVRVWTGLGPTTATMPGESSQTWDGVGDLGSIDAVRESADGRQNGVNITLSGVDNDLLGSVLTENYQGRSAKMWVVFFDSSYAIVDDPVQFFGGIMDVMSTADGDPNGIITVQCESREAQLRRPSVSFLTNQEQQRLFPGDLFLGFVQELQSKEILWGVPSPAGAIPGSSGGSGGFGGEGYGNLTNPVLRR